MSGAAAIPDAWKEWLLQNRDRGCDPEGLMQRALDQGFAREAIAAVARFVVPWAHSHGLTIARLARLVRGPPHPAGAPASRLAVGYLIGPGL